MDLEKELCGIAKTRSAGEALRRLGIVDADSPDAVLEEVEAWTCAGDCYTYRFRVLLPEAAHEVVLKAVVAFSIARSLTEMAEEWVRRRRLLEREGVLPPSSTTRAEPSSWSNPCPSSYPTTCAAARRSASGSPTR